MSAARGLMARAGRVPAPGELDGSHRVTSGWNSSPRAVRKRERLHEVGEEPRPPCQALALALGDGDTFRRLGTSAPRIGQPPIGTVADDGSATIWRATAKSSSIGIA